MNNKNNNISQFDELFKQGLENHSVTAPSGVFEAVSAATSASAVGAKAVVAKWLIGGLVAVSAAVGGYYAFNGNDQINRKAALITEETETNSTSNKLDSDADKTSAIDNTEGLNSDKTNFNLATASNIEEPSNGIQVAKSQRHQLTIEDTIKFTNTPHFYQNDESMFDETEVIDRPQSSYAISIKGNICNGSTFNMILNTSKKVEWFVNDEKLVSSSASLPYQFLEKRGYSVVAYVDGKKVADTFINMTAPKVEIEQQELGSGGATLTAKTSEIRNAEWMYNGKVLSSQRQFAFDKNLYKTAPYLVTTDKQGCKDTFKTLEVNEEPSFSFVQTVITPNGDGKNDDYEVSIKGYETFVMIISDINGKPIFTSNNPEVHWDGKDQRTQLPCKVGEYAVYINYKLKNSIKTEKKYGKVILTK